MRRRVMAPDLLAPHRVDGRVRALAATKEAGAHLAVVGDGLAGVLRIGDVKNRLTGGNRPAVADLTALFGIERRVVEDDLRRFAGDDLVDRLAVAQQHHDLAVGFQARVAVEHADDTRQIRHVDDRALFRGVRASARALLFHRLLESFEIDGDAAFHGDLARELERKTVRVVQRKGIASGNYPRAVGDRLV